MVRRAALFVAAALVLGGCQSLVDRIEAQLAPAAAPLDLERRVDLLPPEGLRITSTADRSIALAWSPVLVGDVAGYAVLRAEESKGPFVVVGRTGSRFGTVFVDEGAGPERLGDGKAYHYRIHPLDFQDAVSRSHAYISATTDARPEPPAGLRAYSNLPRKVVLAWEPNSSESVDGYAVMRSPTVAGPWERVGYAGGRLNTVHEDPVPGDLRVMYYRLVAVNHFGGESDQTEPIRAVTKAEPLPPVGLDVKARALGRVELVWIANVERDLAHYQVLRAKWEARGERWGDEVEIATVDGAETALVDRDVGCGARVRYRMRARDRDELVSGYSSPLEVTGEDLALRLEDDAKGRPVLAWRSERAKEWPLAEVLELRTGLPDRVLGQVAASGPFPLAEVSPGRRTLAVTLLEGPPVSGDGSGEPARAPRCTIRVEVPKSEQLR